jgi:hypothetical protein
MYDDVCSYSYYYVRSSSTQHLIWHYFNVTICEYITRFTLRLHTSQKTLRRSRNSSLTGYWCITQIIMNGYMIPFDTHHASWNALFGEIQPLKHLLQGYQGIATIGTSSSYPKRKVLRSLDEWWRPCFFFWVVANTHHIWHAQATFLLHHKSSMTTFPGTTLVCFVCYSTRAFKKLP